MERVLSPTEAIINGKKCLTVGTNNYFGLTFDPSCMQAAIDAIQAEGTGTTGSRIANGSYSEHVALEDEIAAFYGKKHCMVFTTGYQANLGVISTLVGPEDFLLIDADSHASIYDACKQTQAEVVRFKHNNPASLDARLRRLKERDEGDKPGNRLVVLEGIYSMLGDSAPLKEFIEVCKKYGAYVLVDEAHSLGALGENGRGLCEAAGVLDDCHFIVGTFSKTLGAIGGYCVSNDPDFDILRVTVRAYMFTASLPPSIVASVRQALRVVKARPELRKQLWDNVATLYDGLAAQGFKLGPEHGPVVGVHLPDRMIRDRLLARHARCRHLCERRRAAGHAQRRIAAALLALCRAHQGAARAHDRGHDRHRPPDGRARAQAAGGRLADAPDEHALCHPERSEGSMRISIDPSLRSG